jgi:hypothetical protein
MWGCQAQSLDGVAAPMSGDRQTCSIGSDGIRAASHPRLHAPAENIATSRITTAFQEAPVLLNGRLRPPRVRWTTAPTWRTRHSLLIRYCALGRRRGSVGREAGLKAALRAPAARMPWSQPCLCAVRTLEIWVRRTISGQISARLLDNDDASLPEVVSIHPPRSSLQPLFASLMERGTVNTEHGATVRDPTLTSPSGIAVQAPTWNRG